MATLLEWAAGSWGNVAGKCLETSKGDRYKVDRPRDRALKIILKGWKGFVVHTNTVAQGKTVSKDRAHHLNSTLTNLKFVLFAQSCSEFLTSIQSLSIALQFNSATVDGVLQKLAATKERLETMSTTVSTSVAEVAQGFGDSLTYQGEQLKVPRGYANKEAVVTAVVALMKQLISGAISALDARFSTFESDEVLKLSSVFSPSTWPSEHAVLAKYGYEEIHLLSTHFANSLQQQGYTHLRHA